MSASRDQLGDVLQIQTQVWRHEAAWREAAGGIGKRELQAEKAIGRDFFETLVYRVQLSSSWGLQDKNQRLYH